MKALMYIVCMCLLTLPREQAVSVAKPKLWVFVTVDCPIARYYGGEWLYYDSLSRANGVSFCLVFYERGRDYKKYLEEYGVEPLCVCKDNRKHSLKKYGINVTPMAVLVSEKGEVLYRGAIDNRFEAIGVKRSVANAFYVRDALTSLGRGEPIVIRETAGVGCVVQ